jgi:hypothetical protein
MVNTRAMSVIPVPVRRTLVTLGVLAGLMLTMGQACATPQQGTHNTGSSSKHGESGKNTNTDYDRYGYDQAGYDRNGYDRSGYDKNGYDEDGYDQNGYDRNDEDRYGYDRNGYNGSGCNRAGYDRDGDTCSSRGNSHSSGDDHKSDDDS